MKEKKQNWYKNQRKYHFIYKTTCLLNGKFYYGMHSTDDLKDGYIGSGTRLWHSIKKHGIENFSIEILEFCDDRESLKKREAELITEEVLQDEMCMNLKLGGEGGFHLTKEQISARNSKINKKTGEAKMKLINANPDCREKSVKTRKLTVGFKTKGTTGLKYSEESKIKMSNSGKGESNSQHGTCWIFSEVEKRSLKIKIEELDFYISCGWSRGRKIKF